MSRAPEQGARRLGGVLVRLAFALVLAAGLVAVPLVVDGAAPVAYAASDDRIDLFKQSYRLDEQGVLHVTETVVYRFGRDSGRHGLLRTFVTGEEYDKDNDAVYTYDDFEVSSPDGVSTRYTTERDTSGRTSTMTLKIGDPNRTISAPTATYVLSYTITGVMRNSPDYDELYWDAVGTGWAADMDKVQIDVTVPGGAQDVTCFAGPVRSTDACTRFDRTGATITIEQNGVRAGDGLSFGVMIMPGLVADNAPHLEPRERNYALPIGAGLLAATTGGSVLGGVLYWRKRGRDLRYVGLPPGMVPLAGANAEVAYDSGDTEIPVRFTPPRIPVAEAGLLIDGQVDHRETAATLVDLAVRGVVRLHSSGSKDLRAELVDPARASAPHEVVLLTELFGGRPPGAVVDLAKQGSMTDAHDELVTAVRGQVTARGWFRKVPSSARFTGAGVGVLGCVAFVAVGAGAAPLLVLAAPLAPIVVTLLVLRSKLRRGQRTADGRAVCDEVEGFRTYLATAEADQLRFEEGEDIFSRYLPWAMMFELTDRWTTVCRNLIAMGRIPDVQPYWYVGNFRMSTFNTALLYSTLNTSATPVPSSSGSSGTGFGGGSSFGGGGFSGGGGGGGGGGSW